MPVARATEAVVGPSEVVIERGRRARWQMWEKLLIAVEISIFLDF